MPGQEISPRVGLTAREGQGHGELETSHAAASLGQGLTALGGLKWGPGPWTGWRQPLGGGQGQAERVVPSGP